MHLALDVSGDWGEALLHDYYAFAQSRRRDRRPDEDWRPTERTPGYVLALDSLDGDPYVEERVPDPLRDVLADYPRTLDPGDLDDLVTDLRDAVPDDEDTAFRAETRALTIAEFARRHDHGLIVRE